MFLLHTGMRGNTCATIIIILSTNELIYVSVAKSAEY